MLNGDGLRVVLWVSGCDHCCRDCHNPVTWDPNGGLPFDEEAKAELFEALDRDYISGITFSGGDPLYFGNRMDVTELAGEIRERFPGKTIWLYTGYTYEEIKDLEVIGVCRCAGGRRVRGKAEGQSALLAGGSGNQRVIDVPATRRSGTVVLHCE